MLTPLPEKYTDADGVLTADVIGFNRTYQWYANDTNDNTTGTPIPNATGKEFNPADYPAKYYYCVVTSTDVGYDPIEIRTNVTENTTYQSADYTEYNKAVEQAKSLNRDDYVDFSKVDEALAVDVSGKNITEQDIVDKQTKAILEAVSYTHLDVYKRQNVYRIILLGLTFIYIFFYIKIYKRQYQYLLFDFGLTFVG